MFRALLVAAALTGCTSLADRYAAGNAALSTDEGAVYFVVLAPRLQAALNGCIPPGTAGASPVLLIVADVDADGAARNLAVEPDSPGSECVREELSRRSLPRPPAVAAGQTYPIGIRIDTR